jgi:hypothetical protein
MYTCLVPKVFLDRTISLYSSKSVNKKEILRTVCNTGIYCTSEKVGTVTQYNTFSKIPPSVTMHCITRVRRWRVPRLYSVQ